MQEEEKQGTQKNEKTEIPNSEKSTIEETVSETVSETPGTDPALAGDPVADSGGSSDEMLDDISGQLAEMLEKFDEQIEKKEQKTTLFITPSGPIAVTHEISLGNLILATLIFGAIVFNILARLIRR